jgi:polysaccharide export outer membrane protein
MKMSAKLVLAPLCAVALCCGQSDPIPAAKVAAPGASVQTPNPPRADRPVPGSIAQTTPAEPGPQVVADAAPPIEKTTDTKAPEPAKAEPAKAASSKTAAGADPRHAPYLIGPLDVLVVKVWNNLPLSGVYDVHQDGMMSMPLIGDVKAEDLTTNQLQEVITKKLDDCCIRTPIVNIEVGKNNSKWYFVYGEVGKPGQYPLSRATTVMDALADVGGFRDFANVKKIRIQHQSPGGKVEEHLFNYKDVSHGRHFEQNILLQHGDRIFVGQ